MFKNGSVFVLLILLSDSMVAQVNPMTIVHKMEYRDKMNVLRDIWQKPIQWIPGKYTDVFSIGLPDSILQKGPIFLDTLMAICGQTYFYFALNGKGRNRKFLRCQCYNEKDSARWDSIPMTYSIIYNMSHVRKYSSPFGLCQSFMWFSPYTHNVVEQYGELTVRLRLLSVFKQSDPEKLHCLAGWYAGIIGKYIQKRYKGYDRLLFIWQDNDGSMVQALYEPKTVDFKHKFRLF